MKYRFVCVTVTASWPENRLDFSCFSRILECYGEKTQSRNRAMCICLFLTEKQCWHYLYFDQHSRIRGKHENQRFFPFKTIFHRKVDVRRCYGEKTQAK